jgi:hypothetical protein
VSPDIKREPHRLTELASLAEILQAKRLFEYDPWQMNDSDPDGFGQMNVIERPFRGQAG